MKKQLLPILLLCALLGCKKDNNTTSAPDIPTELSKAESKNLFSKVLAKAVKNDKVLREFIKTESLKEFDNDNDVLISMIKDIKLSDGQTFYEKLLKAGLTKEQYEKVLSTLPTLTILVPTVPNFSPSEWNTNIQIPSVASSPSGKDASVKVFDAEEKVIEVPIGLVPGFPVLVIKENERVNARINGVDMSPISARKLSSGQKQATTFYKKGGVELSFSNEAFNGKLNVPEKVSRIVDQQNTNSLTRLDPRIVEAYDKGYIEWQRDYIYFGIDPASGVVKGPLNRRYKEYIRSIKMVSDEVDAIADQGNDPKPTRAPYLYVGRGTTRPSQASLWFDGAFDIRITVSVNTKSGTGKQYDYAITAKGSDLYFLEYEQVSNSSTFHYVKATPQEFFINQPIDTWDLENYGSTWTFTVMEDDPSEETSRTVINSTKYTTNFSTEVGFGEKFKVGAKLGGSTESEQQTTHTIKTTTASDFIGQGILNFSDPIMTGKRTVAIPRSTKTVYDTWNVQTGKMYLSVEPVLITSMPSN